MKRWYVLHTKVLAEKRVASELQQRDLSTYLPLLPGDSGKKDAKPLFPGYLFARLNLDSGNPANWKWIPGLRYLVTFGDVAAPVPDELIRSIEDQIRTMQATRTEGESPFKQGDVVRIKDGPFADMLAVFDRTCAPSKRVQILLEALDRSVKLRIGSDRLEKAPGGEHIRMKRRRRTRGRGRPSRHQEKICGEL